jgi:hypothetical protein
MLIRQTLFTALALFDLTNAGFFYFPKYRCIEDHTCIESRGVNGDVVGRSSDMSFELVQRLPKVTIGYELPLTVADIFVTGQPSPGCSYPPIGPTSRPQV